MLRASRFVQLTLVLVFALVSSLAVVSDADARRAGGFSSFGSRGARTFSAPPVTSTAPTTAAPIQRSMTPQSASPQFNQQPGMNTARPGFFSGFGGSLLGGLMVGGLVGMFLGHGFGGGAGFLGMLLQIAIIAIGGMWLMRFLAGRQSLGYAAPQSRGPMFNGGPVNPNASYNMNAAGLGSGAAASTKRMGSSDEIGIQPADFDKFEALLTKVQTAYGAEDYGTLRAVSTPEAMSYLAEELGENATRGVRNVVSQVKLLQGDLAEAWREGGSDYATVAMRYSSIDAMVDRKTGRVVDGDERMPGESTEIWTFVRKAGSDWQLSAIQSAEMAVH